jgi:hypothetical protein
MDNFQDLFYFPMMLIYDLGLVGIFLYLVTQKGTGIRLPWPRLKWDWEKMANRRLAKPKIFPFVLMLLGFAALVYFYIRHHTLFFKSLNPGAFESMFSPEASQWYSLALLSLFGIGILATLTKFFIRSEWVDLIRSACQLLILGIVINRPIENAIQEFFYFDVHLAADLIVVLIALLLVIDFLRSLITIGIKTFRKKLLAH